MESVSSETGTQEGPVCFSEKELRMQLMRISCLTIKPVMVIGDSD